MKMDTDPAAGVPATQRAIVVISVSSTSQQHVSELHGMNQVLCTGAVMYRAAVSTGSSALDHSLILFST